MHMSTCHIIRLTSLNFTSEAIQAQYTMTGLEILVCGPQVAFLQVVKQWCFSLVDCHKVKQWGFSLGDCLEAKQWGSSLGDCHEVKRWCFSLGDSSLLFWLFTHLPPLSADTTTAAIKRETPPFHFLMMSQRKTSLLQFRTISQRETPLLHNLQKSLWTAH